MRSLRDIDIAYVKGIGPKRARLLTEELGISSAYDLVYNFPTHYIDRSSVVGISDFQGDNMPSVQTRGRFLSFTEQGEGAKSRLVGRSEERRVGKECRL